MELVLNINGSLVPDTSPVFKAANRGYRYGDGIFETLNFTNGEIRFRELHFHRLFNGLKALEFSIPSGWTPVFFENQILDLCRHNELKNARIRLSISRGEGPFKLTRNLSPVYLIESFPVQEIPESLPDTVILGIYPDMRKCSGPLSHLKTANYLPYIMGKLYAEKLGATDAVILNEYNRICEATTSNIFWIKNEIVYTTPIIEGPVAGIMRQNMLTILPAAGIQVIEKAIEMEELLHADEVFLTNVIIGIKAVNQIDQVFYGSAMTSGLQQKTGL